MQLKKIVIATTWALGLTALTGCHAADNGATPQAAAGQTAAAPAVTGKVMAVVNGSPIPQAELNALEQDRTAQGQPVNDQIAAALRESLIDGEILAQQAVKQGLDQDSNLQMRLKLAKTQMLAQAFLANYVKAHPITEAAMKAEYDRAKTAAGDKEYEVEHILVASEGDARKIIAQLNQKAKFETLAKKDSKDSTAQNGGNLGWVTPAGLVKPFSDAMVQLKKGEYTKEPVKTQFGWHVIRLVDIRELKFPPYDQVKAQVRAGLEQQEVKKEIADLRAAAKVE
uniref:Putative PpiC-type peptidyl-prolyl cis-trans isomerase n=1 Tax=mine drainage metagenome TaxID=410659 RepID=E6QS63_9ZZZZ